MCLQLEHEKFVLVIDYLIVSFIAKCSDLTGQNMYNLRDLQRFVVKDRDYKKLSFAILGLGVFGLFFSIVLFPQIGYHVFKWVSTQVHTYLWIIQALLLFVLVNVRRRAIFFPLCQSLTGQ